MLSESTPGRASCALPAAGTGILSAITRFISQRAFDTGTAALRQQGAAATGARSVRAPATARDDNETAATALPWSQAVRAPRHSRGSGAPLRRLASLRDRRTTP